MLFNVGKCKCLHTGPGNTDMNYEMGGTILSKTGKEKSPYTWLIIVCVCFIIYELMLLHGNVQIPVV